MHTKAFHRKAVWTVRVAEPGSPYMLFANQRSNAGQGHIQTQRLWQLRCEESELYLAAVSRFCMEKDAHHPSGRRMRLKVEMQELQQHITLQNGQRGFDGALV